MIHQHGTFKYITLQRLARSFRPGTPADQEGLALKDTHTHTLDKKNYNNRTQKVLANTEHSLYTDTWLSGPLGWRQVIIVMATAHCPSITHALEFLIARD